MVAPTTARHVWHALHRVEFGLPGVTLPRSGTCSRPSNCSSRGRECGVYGVTVSSSMPLEPPTASTALFQHSPAGQVWVSVRCCYTRSLGLTGCMYVARFFLLLTLSYCFLHAIAPDGILTDLISMYNPCNSHPRAPYFAAHRCWTSAFAGR